MQNSLCSPANRVRVVLFLTHPCPGDVPGADHPLACLLPLGTASFVERVMDSCALSGVQQIDVVVSEHPEILRLVLQDGTPWGIRINWHHAKATAHPYSVLQGMSAGLTGRIVIGHAHHWVSSRIVCEMLHTNGVALVGDDSAWTGWFSTDFDEFCALGPHADYDSLDAQVRCMEDARRVPVMPAEYGKCLCASDLLAAQRYALDGSQEAAIPPHWLSRPWGAASPDAVIHADARIIGPVLIGPGSVIEAGTELGPGTVLTRDIFLARGACVRDSVVMANTYVGGQVTLENVLAQGNSIQSLKWSLRTVLNLDDAIMVPLYDRTNCSTPWISRAIAVLAVVVLSPLMLPALLLQRADKGHALWRKVAVVQSRFRNQEELLWVQVRITHSERATDRSVAYFGSLLDIVQGRRCWFGLRPRQQAEWNALGRDWQDLFSRTAIGLFHAPALKETGGDFHDEAYAVADAFMAAQSTMTERIKILCSYRWRSLWHYCHQ